MLSLLLSCYKAPLALAPSADPLPEEWVPMGAVEVSMCHRTLMGFIPLDDSYGMADLVDEAVGDADGLSSVRVDVRTTNWLIGSTMCHDLSGTRIRDTTDLHSSAPEPTQAVEASNPTTAPPTTGPATPPPCEDCLDCADVLTSLRDAENNITATLDVLGNSPVEFGTAGCLEANRVDEELIEWARENGG